MTGNKRSIFEEVGQETRQAPAAQPGGAIDRGRGGARQAVRLWLMALFALVVLMIAVGGLTRLTDSGLSITEWRPVTGAIPPLGDAAWEAEFEKYRQIDEFQRQNSDMTLAEFKVIYWWEWGHRQLGRVVGLVWAVGFVGFLATRRMPPGWTGRLLLLGALGGLQGAIGWWMVSSGLAPGMLDVASYRLAVHLGLAFAILGLIAWYANLLARSEAALMQARREKEAKRFSLSTGLMHFTFVQILLGALVAGIDAGRSFTDWPLMGGQVIPMSAFDIAPWWRNFFENPALVQFLHRLSGYLLLAFGIVVWLRGRKSPNRLTARTFDIVMAALAVQIVIGIVTVYQAAPLHWALLHQLTAVALWVLIIRARFLSLYPRRQSLRGAA